MIYLYVKKHKKTGLKYFGKTTKQDPHLYAGSGKYWRKHLKKHGFEYDTEIIGVFEDILECEKAALQFSKLHNIVNSEKWANLKEENGKDGSPKGVKFSTEHRQKIRERMLGKCHNDFDENTRKKMSNAAKVRSLRSVKNGTNPFAGKRGTALAKKRNAALLKDGKHNFQGEKGSELARKTNEKRVKEGTHSWLKRKDGSSHASERVKNKTHNWLKNRETVSVVNKNGKCIRVSKEIFWSQDENICDREYVGVTSKEAENRLKRSKELYYDNI